MVETPEDRESSSAAEMLLAVSTADVTSKLRRPRIP
jgi:hypothetical protein